MTSNGLICFTNCLLPQEDGSLLARDLWVDESHGTILDAQAKIPTSFFIHDNSNHFLQTTFYLRKNRPAKIIDLGGNILRYILLMHLSSFVLIQSFQPWFYRHSNQWCIWFRFFSIRKWRRQLPMRPRDGCRKNNRNWGDFVCHYDPPCWNHCPFGITDFYQLWWCVWSIPSTVSPLTMILQTQEKSIYPKLLSLLKPFSMYKSATLLGWHAEGPFIDHTKRGAHEPAYLLPAMDGLESFEVVYGSENLVKSEKWSTSSFDPAVRLITAAPEVPGVMMAIDGLVKRGIAVSIGHRCSSSFLLKLLPCS